MTARRNTPCPTCGKTHTRTGPLCRRCAGAAANTLELTGGQWVRQGMLLAWVPTRPAPKRELRPCGTLAAYRRHLKYGEVPCSPCSIASRDYTRERRGITSTKALRPHGTHAAYMRHYLNRTEPCAKCVEAERTYQRDAKRAARARKRAEREAA